MTQLTDTHIYMMLIEITSSFEFGTTLLTENLSAFSTGEALTTVTAVTVPELRR